MWNLIIVVIVLSSLRAEQIGDSWTPPWFPAPPGENALHFAKLPVVAQSNDTWNGTWFPVRPGENSYRNGFVLPDNMALSSKDNDSWDGNWFPLHPKLDFCDDAEHNLAIDFDPTNAAHHLQFRCLDNRDDYKSNYSVQPVTNIRFMPISYQQQHRCMNTPILYPEGIPMYGESRPIGPELGEYSFIPVQRWMHSLSKGVVVVLYHPCATASQVDVMRKIVTTCTQRHIITASNLPTPQRPIVMVGWGVSLAMSAVDANLVRRFLQDNVELNGYREKTAKRNGDNAINYTHLLVQPAVDVPPQLAANCQIV